MSSICGGTKTEAMCKSYFKCMLMIVLGQYHDAAVEPGFRFLAACPIRVARFSAENHFAELISKYSGSSYFND